MTENEVKVAILQEKVSSLEDAYKQQVAITQQIGKDLTEVVTTFRLFKWIIGVAIAAGPALGVAVGKLFSV